MKNILVLHGPNLNLLGKREPDLYGQMTLDTLNQQLMQTAQTAGCRLEAKQSNSESELINWIHQAADADAPVTIIFNPAALTHTSIALRDALLATAIPFIEVHISNIFARENYRKTSYFSDIATGVISGFGVQGYFLALQYFIETHQ